MLSSCSNALYFYETDKISLTAEFRPDSTEPVQGNLGIKQRVALITPGVNSAAGEETGEALSVISSFRFSVKPTGLFLLSPVNIFLRTAMITGDAANCLTFEEAEAAAEIIALEGENNASTSDNADALVKRLKKEGADLQELKNITNKPYNQLSDPDFTRLENITSLGRSHFNNKFYEALRARLNSEGE